MDSESIEPPETLAQSIKTGAFGDKCIEAEISAYFETLRGDDNDGTRRSFRRTGAKEFRPFLHKRIAVERTHSASEQDNVGPPLIVHAKGFAEGIGNRFGGGDSIHHDGNARSVAG